MAVTVTATLPTITATALGGWRNPTAFCGITAQQYNSQANFFMEETKNVLVNVAATATSTQTSPQIINAAEKGVVLFINVATVQATTTLGINLQIQDDAASTNWITLNRISLDAQSAPSFSAMQFYPGVAAVPFAVGGVGATNQVVGRTWRVVASVTATASAGGAGVTFTVSGDTLI